MSNFTGIRLSFRNSSRKKLGLRKNSFHFISFLYDIRISIIEAGYSAGCLILHTAGYRVLNMANCGWPLLSYQDIKILFFLYPSILIYAPLWQKFSSIPISNVVNKSKLLNPNVIYHQLSPYRLYYIYPVEAKKGQCCKNFIYQQGPLLDGFSFTVRACEVKHDFSGWG